MEIISVVQSKTHGVIFDSFFFLLPHLTYQKSLVYLSTKCTHNPPSFLSLCFHSHFPSAFSTEQPKRFCFVVSQIMFSLLPWAHILLPLLDHCDWASFALEQARCVSTLRLTHLLFSLQGMLFPQIFSWLISHLLKVLKCHLLNEYFPKNPLLKLYHSLTNFVIIFPDLSFSISFLGTDFIRI